MVSISPTVESVDGSAVVRLQRDRTPSATYEMCFCYSIARYFRSVQLQLCDNLVMLLDQSGDFRNRLDRNDSRAYHVDLPNRFSTNVDSSTLLNDI